MRILLPFLLLIGCGVGAVNEDNFAIKYAQAQCQNLRDCYPVAWYVDPDDMGIKGDQKDRYPEGSMSDCLYFYEGEGEDLFDGFDAFGCDLDEEKATECLNGTASSCKAQAINIEDINDACEEMFECR
jgi:hypothetical protein